jgi:hypothetical protein
MIRASAISERIIMEMNKEPWPSNYESLGERTPTKLVGDLGGTLCF